MNLFKPSMYHCNHSIYSHTRVHTHTHTNSCFTKPLLFTSTEATSGKRRILFALRTKLQQNGDESGVCEIKGCQISDATGYF